MRTGVPPPELMTLLLSLANQEGIQVGKTKLVKLLYLLEVEFYRENRQRLTDLKWVFFHYGPYPVGLDDLLESPDIEVLPRRLTDGRRFEEVTVADAGQSGAGFDPALERLARRVVDNWGGLELSHLLNYVYFETEPMMHAVRGDVLDFSTVKPPEPVRNIVVDPKRLAQIRKSLDEHLRELPLAKPGCEWDPVLAKGLKLWDDGHRRVEIAGSVELDADLLRRGDAD
jgi:hypothetical protein